MSLARNLWPTRRRPPARSALLSIAVTHACLFAGVFLVGFLAEGTAAPGGVRHAAGREDATSLERSPAPDLPPGPLEAELAVDGIRVVGFEPDEPVPGPLDPDAARPDADR